MLTHTGSMTVDSVSGSFYEPCFVGSVNCVLMVSWTPWAPTILLPLFCNVPKFCLIFCCQSLYLFPSTARESLSVEDWTSRQSMSIAEYSRISLRINIFCQSYLVIPLALCAILLPPPGHPGSDGQGMGSTAWASK